MLSVSPFGRRIWPSSTEHLALWAQVMHVAGFFRRDIGRGARRRIGEVDAAAAIGNHVVGPAERLPVECGCQRHRALVGRHRDDAPACAFGGEQPAVAREEQAVGAVRVLTPDGNRAVRFQLVGDVGGNVAEEQPAVGRGDRPLQTLEAAPHLFHTRTRCDDACDCGLRSA